MGCFSFICKECGKAILSNSFRGEKVNLFLLKDGIVIDNMIGEYDSYGRVFDDDFESIHWKMKWSDVCDLIFSDNDGSGIAAIHSKCFHEIPSTMSDDDPNQGWGSDIEFLSDSP